MKREPTRFTGIADLSQPHYGCCILPEERGLAHVAAVPWVRRMPCQTAATAPCCIDAGEG
jgi:hypothetical protein